MYPENPEGTEVIVGSMNMGYISDTARNRTHNLFRLKRELLPLGHSDGRKGSVFKLALLAPLHARSRFQTGNSSNRKPNKTRLFHSNPGTPQCTVANVCQCERIGSNAKVLS